MREKIIALARGDFAYDMPALVLPELPLKFSVTAGGQRSYSFTLTNARGTKIKGFGAAEDVHIDFLPFFHSAHVELTLEVNAEELSPGEHLRGELLLVTDCGETPVPYDIAVVSPQLRDEKGAIRDYHVLRERMEDNPEHGAELFLSEDFRRAFLYRDEMGGIIYDYLTKKNTKLQGMEEFLVAMGKKDPIRFEVFHESGDFIQYELNGADVQDTLRLRINTEGHTGIYVVSTADFIEPHTHVLWTDEFEHRQDFLEFAILADRVPRGRRFGQLVLQTPYEKKTIAIEAHNPAGGQERKVRRAKKAVMAAMIRMYLAYRENRITQLKFREFLKKNRQVLEKAGGRSRLAIKGYISIILCEEEDILNFFQEAEKLHIPPLGSHIHDIENYILIEFIKFLYTQREEDRERLLHLIKEYEENGYQSGFLTYVCTQVDDRYRSLRLLEKDVRAQLEAGSRIPFLYSVMVQAYREDPTLIASLDRVTSDTISYGLKQDLITEEMAMAVSFLADRLPRFDSAVFRILQSLYDLYAMPDTLHAICSMLIRNGMRQEKYFPWFAKGVEEHLRLTELFEYYMDTMDLGKEIRLPDVVLSYFQYENHLNETCKAFLFSYIVERRQEHPDFYRIYSGQIREFAYRQLSRRRISPDLAVLYRELFGSQEIRGKAADDLAHIMFTYGLWCDNEGMDGVAVIHRECRGETYYPLENGYVQIQIYTPNAQIFFVDDRGRYYAGTVDYRLEKLLDLDDCAWQCYEEGAGYPGLLVHLAAKAERAARMKEQYAELLYRVMGEKLLREPMQQKILLRLYDHYRETKNTSGMLEILDLIEPGKVKRERLADVAAACVYHGLYEKAAAMLCRDGIEQCEVRALSMLVTELLQEKEREFEPLLVKWALHLFRKECYEKAAMEYLMRYYMGGVHTLAAICRKCKEMPEVGIGEEENERLLAQVLFTGADLTGWEPLYEEYYEKGENRILAKAFLSQLAYGYVVEQNDLSESMFAKIEKEALYEKDPVMILAALRGYCRQETFSDKQKEFIEINLERFVDEGLVLAFMKDFSGKANVPYEIENTVLIQYYSGTDRDVFLLEEKPDGKTEQQPMKQVFPGVFTREMLLFGDEEKRCYIYEEETGEKTERITVKRPEHPVQAPGFFQMVDRMIEADQQGDEETRREVQAVYEKARYAAGQLFEIHG